MKNHQPTQAKPSSWASQFSPRITSWGLWSKLALAFSLITRNQVLAGEPYIANPIPQQTVTPGQSVSFTIDLNQVFLDPERQPLIYGGVQMADNRLQLPSWLTIKPDLVSTYHHPLGESLDNVIAHDNLAFILNEYSSNADAGVLYTIDITDKSNPTLLSTFNGVNAETIESFAHDGGEIVYLVNSGYPFSTLQLVNMNISNPALPSLQSSLQVSGAMYDISLQGDYVYLADNNGVKVVNISDASNPTLVGNGLSGVNLRAITHHPMEPMLYGHYNNLYCINSTDSANLTVLSTITAGGYRYVTYANNIVYTGSLQLTDVMDPSNPRLLAQSTISNVEGITVVANALAFATINNAGLNNDRITLINITDSSTPTEVASFITPISIRTQQRNMEIQGNIGYVAGGGDGLNIFNLSQIQFTGTAPLSPSNYDLRVSALSAEGEWISAPMRLVVSNGHSALSNGHAAPVANSPADAAAETSATTADASKQGSTLAGIVALMTAVDGLGLFAASRRKQTQKHKSNDTIDDTHQMTTQPMLKCCV